MRFRDISAPAIPGRDVLGLLLDVRAPVTYLCMAGSCRHCRVKVLSGMEHLEPRHFTESADRIGLDERLSCQAKVTGTGDVVVDQR